MKRITTELEKLIIEDYNNSISTMTISRKYGISRSTVQKYLIKNNIKLHKAISTLSLNVNFFSTYTPESCYWAGFILADGYVRNKRNSLEICLSKIDDSHLLNFLTTINCDKDIRKYHNNACRITICYNKIKEDLYKNFDIFNNKSLTCYISNKIPNKMLPHFIRGYFDGDGCFSDNRIQFIGTYQTCDFIRHYFAKNNILKNNNSLPKIGVKMNKNPLYYIKYSKAQSNHIINLLYKNSTSLTRLERKYNKILSFKNVSLQ